MASPTLTGLPLELLVHLIANYLSTKDFGALRVTNKHLERALFDTFAREFFTKKQFMLTTPSLQTLVDISKHGALSKTLNHVIIGVDLFDPTQRSVMTPADAHETAFRSACGDQFSLLCSGRGRDMLIEAFRNLVSIDTLGLRDYSAQGRDRDNNCWESYGRKTVYLETGRWVTTGSSEFASQIFVLLMQALADAKRSVPSIETILRSKGTGLNDFSFFLPSPLHGFNFVLGGLQVLLLTLDMDHIRSTGPAYPDQPRGSYIIETFLLQTSALKHLRLNFTRIDRDRSPLLLQHLSQIENLLPNLQRLDLGMIKISPENLSRIVFKFSSTLIHLSLWKITLTHSADMRWKDSENRFHPWFRFLQDLSPAMHLTSMTIGCISHAGLPDTRVDFVDGKISRECSGDMKIWLPQLIDDLVVAWPQRSRFTHSSSEDSGSEDSDEDGPDESGSEEDGGEDESE